MQKELPGSHQRGPKSLCIAFQILTTEASIIIQSLPKKRTILFRLDGDMKESPGIRIQKRPSRYIDCTILSREREIIIIPPAHTKEITSRRMRGGGKKGLPGMCCAKESWNSCLERLSKKTGQIGDVWPVFFWSWRLVKVCARFLLCLRPIKVTI